MDQASGEAMKNSCVEERKKEETAKGLLIFVCSTVDTSLIHSSAHFEKLSDFVGKCCLNL